MAKHIRRFDTLVDFESAYFDEDVYEICGIGLTFPQWDDFGTFIGYEITRFQFIDGGNNSKAKPPVAPYEWSNGTISYYTKKRYPDIGDDVYNDKYGQSPEPAPFPYNDYMKIVYLYEEKVHESEYVEPWVSLTAGSEITYSKKAK